MRSLLFLFLGLLTTVWSHAQTVTVTPAVFGENDEITITVSDFDPQAEWGVSDLYLWAWYNPDNNGGDAPGNGSWGNSNESAKFTAQNDGTYTFTMVPSTYYGTSGITRIGFLVKSKDGSRQTQDYLYDVGGYQMALTKPQQRTTIVSAGATFEIEATASEASDWTLFADGVPVHNLNASTDYAYAYTVTTTTNFTLQAISGTETASEEFTAAVAPEVTQAALPAGLKDGINLDDTDPTKATLVFYAPGKAFVHVIGDFNNWLVDDNYLMNYDPATDRYWLELTGLDPAKDHLYQYLVEFDINVADPYSTLILDGYGNDQYIEPETFPNLPGYPAGQTHAVTVLRTGESDYNWQVNNFQKPKKEDLVIYELLIRDFDARHSFDAVRDRLDYLEALGINAIELMPVNEYDGNESWGYNPSFHMALDKYYGTKEALKRLVDEAHSRGIAIIIDVVYNHATGQHPYYRLWNTVDGGTGGQASADNPFFNQEATHSYSVFNDFNHQSAAVRDYVKQTAQYWIEEFRIDGMRWDLTKGFTQNCTAGDDSCTNALQQDRIDVLQEYADAQWAVDPDFYVIFEHLGGIDEEEEWANYRKEEGKGIMLWNKQTSAYNEATMGYNEGGKSNFDHASWKTKGFTWPAAVTYMESHDEERLMFKNLQFGNEAGSYSTKDLETALDRMEAAGAFFFTIPGPKMIWQFGELGYEVSIDENGRTGNKPIRWEYFSDPDRKALYETWSDLILLKTEEPIFETGDFQLDLGSNSGLKRIHLQLPSAGAGGIRYVTVIGNFGLEAKAINPGFQQTGVWYEFLNGNKKFIVESSEKMITLQPGEFRIFGDQPSSLFPDENLPDDDHDGVSNTYDTCPDTPLGATVNADGCMVFSLPPDNFTIRTLAETCRNSDNGSILIAAREAHTYTASLNGEAVGTFTADFEIANLTAGNYTLCLEVADENYTQCFELEITEPEDLSVSSKIAPGGKSITLSLKGGDSYHIKVGGESYRTSASEITIPIPGGATAIRVETDKACQGVYEDMVVVHTARLFPNPVVEDLLSVHFNEAFSEQTLVKIYDLNGKLHSVHTADSGSRRLQINTASLAKGVYLVRIEQGNSSSTHKILNP